MDATCLVFIREALVHVYISGWFLLYSWVSILLHNAAVVNVLTFSILHSKLRTVNGCIRYGMSICFDDDDVCMFFILLHYYLLIMDWIVLLLLLIRNLIYNDKLINNLCDHAKVSYCHWMLFFEIEMVVCFLFSLKIRLTTVN